MRWVNFTLAIILTFSGVQSLDAASQKPAKKSKNPTISGFQDIKFGTEYDTVYTKLRERHFVETTPFKESNKILLSQFNLEQITVDVWFMFDHKDRFYAYKFVGEKYTANNIDPYLIDEGKYLNDIFVARFGKPTKHYKVNFFNIKDNYESYINTWKMNNIEAYTALSADEFQYYCVGYIGSVPLAKDIEREREKLRYKDAGKAATNF